MLTTTSYPVAPAITPPLGSLIDAASVSEDFAWLGSDDLFVSYNCMKFASAAVFCAPQTKTFDNSPAYQDGFRFAAYGGVVCKAIGLDQADMKSQVQRVFEVGESTAVEKAMMSTRFVASTDHWAAPTDITPSGGAVKPAVGVALLEGHAAANYVGTPTIHVPRTIASLLLGVPGNVFDGQVPRTALGSKVAAGAGYDYPNTGPSGAAAASGERWIYATGEVVLVRGPVNILQEMNRNTNEVFVLAERPYVLAVDCYTAAVRVQVTA